MTVTQLIAALKLMPGSAEVVIRNEDAELWRVNLVHPRMATPSKLVPGYFMELKDAPEGSTEVIELE